MTSLKSTLKKKLPLLVGLLRYGKRSIVNRLIKNQKKNLVQKIEKLYAGDPDAEEIIAFLKAHSAEMIPYFFTQEYKTKKIEIRTDDEGMSSALVNGNPIYFPREMSIDYITDSVRVGLMEQDERSPHKYLPVNSEELKGDVAVLCGASDCIYALQIIDSFKKIYLFEANPSWVEPIRKTLHKHLHKIEIVPYFISDRNGPNVTTLDAFFETRNSENVNYIQADIEGDELKMLRGAKGLLQRSPNVKLSLCCYHTANQERELTDFLVNHKFTVSTSKGFLLMWMDYPLRPPYLRRGVIYAAK